MNQDLPYNLAQERDRLIEEIRAAFAGVSREGGVSWSEADVRDSYGTMERRLLARAQDRDRR